MTDEQPILKEHVGLSMDLVVGLLQVLTDKIMPELGRLTNELNASMPCKEFQLIAMDVESITQHLESLHTNGPSASFLDVPLEASEIEEEDFFEKNGSAVELAMNSIQGEEF